MGLQTILWSDSLRGELGFQASQSTEEGGYPKGEGSNDDVIHPHEVTGVCGRYVGSRSSRLFSVESVTFLSDLLISRKTTLLAEPDT